MQLFLSFCLCWRRNSKMRVTCWWYVFGETPDHSCMFKQVANLPGWLICPSSAEIFSPPFLYIVQREFNIQAQPLLPSSIWEILQFFSCQISNLFLIIYYTLYEIWLFTSIQMQLRFFLTSSPPFLSLLLNNCTGIHMKLWKHQARQSTEMHLGHHLLSWTMRVMALMKTWHL